MFTYAKEAEANGIQVIIAGAGGAAHLPGMVAALTHLPVFGVPMESATLKRMDSLSIVQMPKGVPVGTCYWQGEGDQLALLAASVVALQDEGVCERLKAHRQAQTDAVTDFPVDP